MPSFKTVNFTTIAEVETRLADFSLTRSQIIEIGKTARAYADDAGPSMPVNAAGMLSYIHGVGELRQQLVGINYVPDRAYGIESVVNKNRTVRIAFQNVDKCCVEMPPIPRSEKGGGASLLSSPSLFEHAGVEVGPLTGVHDGIRTYYVMVGLDGSIELSCPVIDKGKYVAWSERIYIHSLDEEWEVLPESYDDQTQDFDIEVSFKNI